MFALHRQQLPPSLHKCLTTTNSIESPQGGVQKNSGNILHRREADMAIHWVASAWLFAGKRFRRINGH